MEKSNTILWVGKLPRDITQSEIDKEFARFGKILETSMRNGYAFVEYESAKDAKAALEEMDGFKFDRFPIAVSFKEDRKRQSSGKGGPTSTDICFNCGKLGHWANECRENDWRKSSRKCRYCGKYGHSERECRYKPSSSSSSRSRSSRRSSRSKSANKHSKRRNHYSKHTSSPSRSSSHSHHNKQLRFNKSQGNHKRSPRS